MINLAAAAAVLDNRRCLVEDVAYRSDWCCLWGALRLGRGCWSLGRCQTAPRCRGRAPSVESSRSSVPVWEEGKVYTKKKTKKKKDIVSECSTWGYNTHSATFLPRISFSYIIEILRRNQRNMLYKPHRPLSGCSVHICMDMHYTADLSRNVSLSQIYCATAVCLQRAQTFPLRMYPGHYFFKNEFEGSLFKIYVYVVISVKSHTIRCQYLTQTPVRL